MKIIIADNLNRDYFNEAVFLENVPDMYAAAITWFLNETYVSDFSETYFKVVADNHQIQTFNEY